MANSEMSQQVIEAQPASVPVTSRRDQLHRRLERLKKGIAVGAVVAFGGVTALVVRHPVGVTAHSTPSTGAQTTPSGGAQPPGNGGFFGDGGGASSVGPGGGNGTGPVLGSGAS